MDPDELDSILSMLGPGAGRVDREPSFDSLLDDSLSDEPMGRAMLRESRAPSRRAPFQPESRAPLRVGPVSIGGESIDDLLASMAEGASRMRPSFGRGLMRGLTRGPVRRMRERDERNEQGALDWRRGAAQEQDERGDLRRAAIRMGTEAQARRRKDVEMVPVPGWMAQALGREDLIGQSIPGAQWDRLRQMFDDRMQLTTNQRAGREKPAKADPWEGLSARDRYKIENVDKRIGQIETKIEQWRMKLPGASKSERATIEQNIARLEADHEARMREREGLLGDGGGEPAGGPGTAAPAPSAPPTAAPADSGAEVAKLKREAKQRQGELKATGALSGQRRTQAQGRLNAIQKRLMELGDPGLNALSNKQGYGVQTSAPAPTAVTDQAIAAVRGLGLDSKGLEKWLKAVVDGETREQGLAAEGVQIATLRKAFMAP